MAGENRGRVGVGGVEHVESVESVEAVSVAVDTKLAVRYGGRIRRKKLGQLQERLSEEPGTSRFRIEFKFLRDPSLAWEAELA